LKAAAFSPRIPLSEVLSPFILILDVFNTTAASLGTNLNVIVFPNGNLLGLAVTSAPAAAIALARHGIQYVRIECFTR